jgi:phosphoglycerate dehydrogenase-like enzyme
VTRRLVADFAVGTRAWRIPPSAVRAIAAALGAGWEIVEVEVPGVEGELGPGTREAVRAVRGAEIYLGYGVAPSVAAEGYGTLRWVHSGTAGIGDSLPHLIGAGVIVTNSAAVHAEPIADWVVAVLGYFARGLDRMRAAQGEARWARAELSDMRTPVLEFRDLRIGVFGLGGIGSAVARRAVSLGMPVAGVRRRPERGGPDGLAWVGGPDALRRLAAVSDVLVIAAPATRASAGAVNRAVLAELPDNAVVVNVARGSLLDEAALLDELNRGRLRGAALDVFATEPLPPDHPFWAHPRILVSPHVSAVTARFWERETGLIVENVRRSLGGMRLLNVVDQEAGY